MKLSSVALATGILLSVVSTNVYAGSSLKDSETGYSFASTQDVWGRSWVGVGVGAREKYTVNVYAIALYVEKERGSAALKKWLEGDGKSYWVGGALDLSKAKSDQKLYNTLINCGCGRGVEIKMARAVSGADIKKAFTEGLTAALGDLSSPDIAGDVEKLLGFFNYDLSAGSQFKFYFSAGGSLSATGPGGDITIKNSKLAKGLLKVWLGSSPVQSDLKTQLVSNLNALLQ